MVGRKNAPLLPLSLEDINLIWSKVNIGLEDECWLWLGNKTIHGYGRLMLNGNRFVVTRLIYYIINNVDPGELIVCHSCDNPCCCNPKHLWIGTDADNNLDMMIKQRNNPPKGVRNIKAKLTDKNIVDICNSKKENIELAKIYKVSDANIADIRLGNTWQHVKRIKTRRRPKALSIEIIDIIKQKYSEGSLIKELARELGVSRTSISRYVNGERRIVK